MTDFNQAIIDEFHANDGYVETNGFRDRLVLVHHRGAQSGEERTNPLMAIARDDGWLIAASAGGATKNPDWYYNLLAHPDITIEVPVPGGVETIPVTARDLQGAERDAGWELFKAESPGFAAYEQKAGGRVIPVILLSPR